MTRPKPRAPYDLDLTTEVDERLDQITRQVRNVADTLRDSIEAVGSGDMPVDHLGPLQRAAETLVHAWELEADLLRRRPR